MTDETLAGIARRADIVDSIDYVCDEDTMRDLRRLLDENARLNAELHGHRNLGVEYERLRVENIQLRDENDDMRKRVAFAAAVISGDAAEMLAESLKKVRSDLAARDRTVEALSARLTAKNAELDKVIREAAADRFERDTVIAEHKVVAADALDKLADTLENLPSGGEALKGPHWYREGVKAAAAIARDEAYHLRPTAPEMPRPPAEEGAMAPDEETEDAIRGQHQTTVRGGNWVSLRCDCREWELEVPAGLDAMPRLKAAHAEHVAEMVAEGARLAAQKPISGPETAGTGSGRGTGVAETPGTAQAGDAWREFSRVIDEEEPDDILAAALDIPGLWADENQPEAPAEAEHVTAVRSTYRPGYASVLLRLIADAETTTPYYRRPVIVQGGAITDAGFLRDAVAAVWGAVPHLLPSLPVPSTEEGQ